VESYWGTSDKGKRAKFYRLTTGGRRALKAEQTGWEQYVAAVAGVIALRPQEATP
jgi:DNA-binding PadR family transcriptional regulator